VAGFFGLDTDTTSLARIRHVGKNIILKKSGLGEHNLIKGKFISYNRFAIYYFNSKNLQREWGYNQHY
jgi:hypothetical protein